MRRNTEAATVRWSADVLASDLESFEERLPITGAMTAVILIALRDFLERLENDPMLQVKVHEDIAHHLFEEKLEGRGPSLDIRIPTQLYIRFNELIPEWGGATWFIRRVFTHVNATLDHDVVGTQVQAAVTRLLSFEAHSQSTEVVR